MDQGDRLIVLSMKKVGGSPNRPRSPEEGEDDVNDCQIALVVTVHHFVYLLPFTMNSHAPECPQPIVAVRGGEDALIIVQGKGVLTGM